MNTILPVMFWIMGVVAPAVPVDKAVHNMNLYFETVAQVESDKDRYAVNYKTTATSYFQITRGAFSTAKERSKRMGLNVDAKFVSAMGFEEQRNMLFIDLYQREGTNKYIKGILEGNKWVAIHTYYKYHHTKPDHATKVRAERIFKEMYGY